MILKRIEKLIQNKTLPYILSAGYIVLVDVSEKENS
jgi:hypothetical protein